MLGLTARQEEILEFIKECISSDGFPPTRMEISEEFGFSSPNAAEEHLRALARKGAIKLTRALSRGIVIPSFDKGIPVFKYSYDLELPDEHLDNIKDMFMDAPDFFFRMVDHSMQPTLSFDSVLAIKKSTTATNGKIILFRYQDSYLVRRYRRNRNSINIELCPDNLDYDEPIKVNLHDKDFSIKGIVIGAYFDL